MKLCQAKIVSFKKMYMNNQNNIDSSTTCAVWELFDTSVRWTNFFFSIWVFFHEHSQFMRQQGKGEHIYWTPLYDFRLLHRHLDISRAITAESSPLHIASMCENLFPLRYISQTEYRIGQINFYVPDFQDTQFYLYKRTRKKRTWKNKVQDGLRNTAFVFCYWNRTFSSHF